MRYTFKKQLVILIAGAVMLGGGSLARAQSEPDEGMGPPDLDLTVNTLADYRVQADTVLPTYTAALLAPGDGFDWIGNLLIGRLAIAVNDFEPTQIGNNGPMTIGTDTAQNTMMKIDTDQGRVRYVNLGRQFDFDFSSHQAVDELIAESIVLQAMAELNVPSSEYLDATGQCPGCDVATIRGEDYETTDISGNAFSSHEAEQMVTARRSINGYAVFDSMLRASVSNDGDVARLLARWPQFRLPAGLVMRDRNAVLDDIAAGIFDRESGAALTLLQIEVGYIHVGSFHLPVAEVAFQDRDSGAGFHVPLVAVAPDEDLDGVADAADNCPQAHNAAHQVPLDCNGDGDALDPGEESGGQCDRDADGVGDICDNCPDTPNTTQADADGDGTGDLCQQTEGACCGVGDGNEHCEAMSASRCAAAGGTFLGSGTDCAGDANGDGLDDACGCGCAGAADCVDSDQNNVSDDVCIYGECPGTPCGTCTLITKSVPSDISGPFGACPPDGFCNVHDRNQALACFSATSPCASINVDAGGAFGACGPDGFCNVHDANHALTCFSGTNTCSCGPMPEPVGSDGTIAGRAGLAISAPHRVDAGQAFAVKVRLDGDIKSLQSYQLALEASGGSKGRLHLVGITIDATADYVFGKSPRFDAINVERGQMLAGLDVGGLVARDGATLATFIYQASADADGVFVIDTGTQSFLISHYTKEIEIAGTTAAVIAVGSTRRSSH